MRPLSQIKQKIIYTFLYLMYYLGVAALIITVFALIYYAKGIKFPWKFSLEVFFSVEENLISEVYIFIVFEKIMNNLFMLIFVGKILEKFLKPINPIIFSRYLVYDTIKRTFTFRYWVMLSRFEYLYDAKARILLTEYETYQKGVNKMKPIWELDSEIQNLDQIRGIRYVELSEHDSQNLIKSINTFGKKKWSIDFTIRGNDANGNTYYKWLKYRPCDILVGYRFVPLQRHEYESRDFFSVVSIYEDEGAKSLIKKNFFDISILTKYINCHLL